ncbi:D-alanyl-D-alanine carboxypeptidase [Streptomyces sp. NPDC053493]|uniref:D-alanyl-D-alanine carboxypeptidase n=1 Tax=Streptomyces sp. NPDC053493 TaxID=3365705 RepID=UPI0037D93E00
MSDGGGTVAGESPDEAAEQRENAVGGDGKDPRLSVLQGRVDEPTAVFRALAPRTAPEDEPSVTEDAAEDATVAEKPAADAEVSGDGAEAARTPEPKAGAEEPGREPGAAAVRETADEAPAAAEKAAGAKEAPEPERSKAAAEVSGDGAGAKAATDPETADEEPEAAEPEAKAAGAAEPSEGRAEDTGAAPAESWFATRKPAEPKADAKPASGSSPESAATSSPEPKPAPKAEPKPEPKGGPVDQPTAVFKAVKPPVDQPTTAIKMPVDKKPVDQPTTALKLPRSTFRPLQGDITQEQPKPTPEQPKPAPAESKDPKDARAPKPEAKAPAPAAAPAPGPVPASLTEAERTKQQPLPPRPPLEILAELTNTPPPPETPLRTTFRRVKIWTPLVLLLVIVFAVVQFVRPLPDARLVLSASPTYTFEGGELKMPWPGEGQGAAEVEGVGSLGTYGPQRPAPIASVAKTMTAYVILRDHPIKGKDKGPRIEVDKTAGEQAKAKDESTAPIKEGQSFTEKELLELLMIPSGNNVARLLARWDAGSEATFVEKMNAAAKELGMTGSTYTDPSGLQSSTVSTPLDQLKLAKAVMQYDVFREIVDMPNVTVDGIPGQIENNNKILLEPGVAGIKTGSSTPAGGNLLWAAYTVVDGEKRRILGIVMGAKDAPQLWQKLDLAIANSLTLIQKAQADVTSAAVVKKGQVVGYVDDGLGGRTPVVATKELRAVGWPGLKVSLRLGDGGKTVPHTGKAGDVVGKVSIGTGTGEVSAPVELKTDLAEPGFGDRLTRLG